MKSDNAHTTFRGVLLLYRCLIRRYLRKQNVLFARCPTFYGMWPRFSCAGTIVLGSDVFFRSLRLRQYFTVTTSEGKLSIGDGCFINDGANICAAKRIEIGSYCKIGDEVIIYDTHFHPVSENISVITAPVVLEENVWIGARSIILPGVTIGAHSVIAAGAVVCHDVPPNTVVAGVPAKPIDTVVCQKNWQRP